MGENENMPQAHKKEYEKVKMGYQRLRHVSLKLQVYFGNIVALSTLKKAYPWP